MAKGGTLNLYTWPDYFSTKNLSAYKQQTGTTINISTYDSNDVLFAKLNSAGGSSFDIAVPTSGWILTLANHGLLAKLDHTRIPLQYVSPTLLNKVYDPGNVYSIPKDYGVRESSTIPWPWAARLSVAGLLDAGDKPGVSGKVQLSDAAWEVVAIPNWAADGDYNTQDTAKINQYGDTMKAWAKNVKEFGGFDITGQVHGTIAMSQCDQSVGRQCLLQNSKLKWVVPGPTSELWVDNYRSPPTRRMLIGLFVHKFPAPAGPPGHRYRVHRLPNHAAEPSREAAREHPGNGFDLRRARRQL